jgi:hypothetical protein
MAYVVIGLGCAVPELFQVSKRRTPLQRLSSIASALVTVILWPLWAPFALSPRRVGKRRSEWPSV